MAPPRAALIEIFSSIQGEGRHVGVPMSFVRVATCPIRCLYCDTPDSYEAKPTFKVRFGDEETDEPNPVAAERAAELALATADRSPFRFGGGRRAVSVTGGEPLVYPDFVAALGRELRTRRAALHLETAALDPDALARVLPVVDHLSADYKLPATLEAGDHSAHHLACVALGVAASCTVDVKIVLTEDVEIADFRTALDALAPHRDGFLLVLQPVTPFGAVRDRLSPARLASAAGEAAAFGFDLRVLPQVHRVLGVE